MIGLPKIQVKLSPKKKRRILKKYVYNV
jgi:hypothetical protein